MTPNADYGAGWPSTNENGFPVLPPMKKRDIIERIMTQHWDMAACRCWVCTAGRDVGCRPRDQHLDHHRGVLRLPQVRVDALPPNDGSPT